MRKKYWQIILCTVKEPYIAHLCFFTIQNSPNDLKYLPPKYHFKGSFLAIENVFQEGGGGVKTACSLQLANTDPVPDCLGPHPRYCVFVRKHIRFGAFLPTTAARKRSKTWIKAEISGEKRLFETLPFLCGQVKTEDFEKRWWKLLQLLSLLSAFSDLLVRDEIKTLPNVCATEMKKMKVWIKRETKKLVWVKMFSFVASQTKTDA